MPLWDTHARCHWRVYSALAFGLCALIKDTLTGVGHWGLGGEGESLTFRWFNKPQPILFLVKQLLFLYRCIFQRMNWVSKHRALFPLISECSGLWSYTGLITLKQLNHVISLLWNCFVQHMPHEVRLEPSASLSVAQIPIIMPHTHANCEPFTTNLRTFVQYLIFSAHKCVRLPDFWPQMESKASKFKFPQISLNI